MLTMNNESTQFQATSCLHNRQICMYRHLLDIKVALHGPDASNEMLCSLLAEESLAPKPAAQNSRLTEPSRQQWPGLAGGTTDLVIFREL